MILGKDVHPSKKIYYSSALVLDGFKDLSVSEIAFDELFSKMKRDYSMSIEIFMLSLDWLFLLNAIDSRDGKVFKCS